MPQPSTELAPSSASSTNPPVALVTGSGTGVGRACALRFAKLGYRVVVNYSRSSTEAEQTAIDVRTLGSECLYVAADVSNEDAVAAMMAQVESQFGRLDVLVNNAARTHFIPASNLDEMSSEKWDQLLAVNTKGPFFCVRAASKLLAAGEGGCVVNVSSVAGQTGRGSCIAYSASKGALNTLTKSLAIALAPKIRVNAVLPGPIDSRWIREGDNNWDLNEMT
ncbi:MAG: SDR family oxidoreductase, partial [Planctomycetota bacterium]